METVRRTAAPTAADTTAQILRTGVKHAHRVCESVPCASAHYKQATVGGGGGRVPAATGDPGGYLDGGPHPHRCNVQTCRHTHTQRHTHNTHNTHTHTHTTDRQISKPESTRQPSPHQSPRLLPTGRSRTLRDANRQTNTPLTQCESTYGPIAVDRDRRSEIHGTTKRFLQ